MKTRIELRSNFVNFHRRIANQHAARAEAIMKSGGDMTEARRQRALADEHREEEMRHQFILSVTGQNEVLAIR